MINRKTLSTAIFAALFPIAALAQVPTGSLPGSFNTNVPGVTYTTGTNLTPITSATITVPNGVTVLEWGKSTLSAPSPVAAPQGITTNNGFDLGSGASLLIASGNNTDTVLIADNSGNPSEIAGSLQFTLANVIIANANGLSIDNNSGGATVNFAESGAASNSNLVLSGALPDLSNTGVFLSSGGQKLGVSTADATGDVTVSGIVVSGAFAANESIIANNVMLNQQFGGGLVHTININAAGNVQGSGGLVIAGGGHINISFGGMVNNNGAAAAQAAGNPGAWQYNDLPVLVSNGGVVNVQLNPLNPGIHPQFVNMLVNGSVVLQSPATVTDPSGLVNGSTNSTFAPTGNGYPSSHLVIQSTGNITLGNNAGYYWPGLVYASSVAFTNELLNVGTGSINLAGNLSTVVPAILPNGGGAYFETNNLNLNGKQVAVNSNSFVNVLPSSNYAQGFAGGQGQFFAVGNGNGGLALTPLASSDIVGRGMDGSLSGVLPVNNALSSSGTGGLIIPASIQQNIQAIYAVANEPQVVAAQQAVTAALMAYEANPNPQTNAVYKAASVNFQNIANAAFAAAGLTS
jgi:filamentous hemagglutinin family protein